MKILKSVLLSGLLSSSAGAWSIEDTLPGWQFAKEKDGVKIYTRRTEGSVFDEFHATVKMKTTVADLVSLSLDPARCVNWLPDCKTARVVERFSDSKYNIYTEVNNPWPIKNRDYTLQVKLTQNSQSGETLIDFTDVKDAVPESKCCVRMGLVQGLWKFVPVNDGVDVTYEYRFHPGGDLPVSAVNSAVPDLAYDTLMKMKKYIEHPPK